MRERDVEELSNLFQELLDDYSELKKENALLKVECSRFADLIAELAENLTIAEQKLAAIEEEGL